MSNDLMSDTRSTLVDSPAAWYGRDLQDRDDWVELLTPAEVDELLAAVADIAERGISLLEMSRDDFALPTLGIAPASTRRRTRPRAGVLAAAGTAERADVAARRSRRVLGHRAPHGGAGVAELAWPSARSRHRRGRRHPRAGLAGLPDQGAPAVPHRQLRHRRAAVPAAVEVGWAELGGVVDHRVQRDADPPSRPRPPVVPGLVLRPPQRGTARRDCRTSRRRSPAGTTGCSRCATSAGSSTRPNATTTFLAAPTTNWRSSI